MQPVLVPIGRGAGAVQRPGPAGCVKTPPLEVEPDASCTVAWALDHGHRKARRGQ